MTEITDAEAAGQEHLLADGHIWREKAGAAGSAGERCLHLGQLGLDPG